MLRQKKYTRVIHLLTPQVFLFRTSAEYYFIIGYACLKTGDFASAFSYLKRGEDLDHQRLDIQLCLALTCLRRRDEQGALQIWLDILELDPENKRAQQGLELIKLAPEKIDWAQLATQGMLDPLLPPLGQLIMPNPRIFIPLAIIVGSVLGLGILVGLVVSLIPPPSRPGIEALALGNKPADQAGDYSQKPIYIVEPQDIESIFADLRKAFVDYNDNRSRKLINRILYSNAPLSDKQKVRQLQASLGVPGFTNFRDESTYQEVLAEPELHEGVHVRWRGRVSNMRKDPDAQRFDFLVGYEGNVIVEGTVAVALPFPTDIAAGEAVELIGRVVLIDNTPQSKDRFRLEGVAIRIIR
jgi:tetratricopeptide (TPR) repeat protein